LHSEKVVVKESESKEQEEAKSKDHPQLELVLGGVICLFICRMRTRSAKHLHHSLYWLFVACPLIGIRNCIPNC
jgi:hypothetical protein